LENNRFQALTELQARLDHISKPAQQEAEVAREQAGLGKNTSPKDKRTHMAHERSLERQQDTGTKPEVELARLEINPASEQLPPKHQYIPQVDYSDIINEAIEEEQRHV
jgi:hypothetical protein